MINEHEIKAIISKHLDAMLEELGNLNNPCGWIPNNATRILTNSVYSVLEYSKDVENYLESEGMLNKG